MTLDQMNDALEKMDLSQPHWFTVWHHDTKATVRPGMLSEENGMLRVEEVHMYGRASNTVTWILPEAITAISGDMKEEEKPLDVIIEIPGGEERAQEEFLHRFDEMEKVGVKLSTRRGHPSYAPRAMTKGMPSSMRRTKEKQLEKAMHTLIEKGVLEIVMDGPPSKRVQVLRKIST